MINEGGRGGHVVMQMSVYPRDNSRSEYVGRHTVEHFNSCVRIDRDTVKKSGKFEVVRFEYFGERCRERSNAHVLYVPRVRPQTLLNRSDSVTP
jgi:hypothetical protein